MFMMILGVVGAIICVLAYMLIIIERINPKGVLYSAMNGFGGLFLLISIAANYDVGDTGGLVVESCWILISIYGVMKAMKSEAVNV
ncbi:MAG: CBU_0592 family membrane protein [Alphaproteobacteria bacterium]